MKISVIVLNFNGLADTLECLDSLKIVEKGTNDLSITVVDNHSTDNSKEIFNKIKEINFLESEENLGFSGGNNLGIRDSLKKGSELIILLNNDTTVSKNFLMPLVRAAYKTDIISPKIYFAKGYEFHKNKYEEKDRGNVIWFAGGKIDWANVLGSHVGVDEVDRGQFTKSHKMDFATGACMAVKAEVFKKIGFLDEKFFLYLEDMDFCVRAKRAGFKIAFEPKSVIWHKNATSSGGSGSNIQDYFITRNRLLFATRYASLKTKIALARQITSQIKDTTKRKALFDFLTAKFGKGSYLT